MANFVLAYRGGSVHDREAVPLSAMVAWQGWFGSERDSVVDGGAPVGASLARSGEGAPAVGAGSALTG